MSFIYSVENPGPEQVKAIRSRCWHYTSQEVANCAEISLGDLRQFCIGAKDLQPWQLHRLALRTLIYQESKR